MTGDLVPTDRARRAPRGPASPQSTTGPSENSIPPAFAALLTGREAEPVDSAHPGIDGDSWLARLPRLIADALDRWELRVDGASRHGACAIVIPVRRAGGAPAALKLTWPHPEAAHEHLALRAWSGQGAVRLHAADPHSWAMLLERLEPDRDLSDEPIDEACTTIGELLHRLDRPALPQLVTLSEATRAFLGRLERPSRAVPRRFLDQARAIARDLLTEPDLDGRLVHTDLHYENVLSGGAARPREWVAIDPKPLAAEPAYAVWPVLHNRWPDALAADVTWQVRCRLGWTCEAAGIDEERARGWAIVRTVELALDIAESDAAADLTAQVTLLKALQPGF